MIFIALAIEGACRPKPIWTVFADDHANIRRYMTSRLPESIIHE